MADLPVVTTDYFEILVVRELRKVGFEVDAVRIHRRAELPEPERGFVRSCSPCSAAGPGASRR